jgi:hypothetical protein
MWQHERPTRQNPPAVTTMCAAEGHHAAPLHTPACCSCSCSCSSCCRRRCSPDTASVSRPSFSNASACICLTSRCSWSCCSLLLASSAGQHSSIHARKMPSLLEGAGAIDGRRQGLTAICACKLSKHMHHRQPTHTSGVCAAVLRPPTLLQRPHASFTGRHLLVRCKACCLQLSGLVCYGLRLRHHLNARATQHSMPNRPQSAVAIQHSTSTSPNKPSSSFQLKIC